MQAKTDLTSEQNKDVNLEPNKDVNLEPNKDLTLEPNEAEGTSTEEMLKDLEFVELMDGNTLPPVINVGPAPSDLPPPLPLVEEFEETNLPPPQFHKQNRPPISVPANTSDLPPPPVVQNDSLNDSNDAPKNPGLITRFWNYVSTPYGSPQSSRLASGKPDENKKKSNSSSTDEQPQHPEIAQLSQQKRRKSDTKSEIDENSSNSNKTSKSSSVEEQSRRPKSRILAQLSQKQQERRKLSESQSPQQQRAISMPESQFPQKQRGISEPIKKKSSSKSESHDSHSGKHSGDQSSSKSSSSSSSSESSDSYNRRGASNPQLNYKTNSKDWQKQSAPADLTSKGTSRAKEQRPLIYLMSEETEKNFVAPITSLPRLKANLDKLASQTRQLKKLAHQEARQDLHSKTQALYEALVAQDEKETSFIDLVNSIESDDDSQSNSSKELSVEAYVEMTNRILERILENNPLTESYFDEIKEFNNLAENASGSPSRGWQAVGALMMAVGVALMAIGGLIIGGTFGLGLPAGGGILAGGGLAFTIGATLFGKNRRQGLSDAMVKFAESAAKSTPIEEKPRSSDGFFRKNPLKYSKLEESNQEYSESYSSSSSSL